MADADNADAELLALCAQLRGMEEEHERLWALTSDSPKDVTPEDHAWTEFRNYVWPGYCLTDDPRWADGKSDQPDIPGRLLTLRASTWEGLAIKAAAVLAMDNVPGLDCRSDSYELNRSVIEDAAALRLPGART